MSDYLMSKLAMITQAEGVFTFEVRFSVFTGVYCYLYISLYVETQSGMI